MPQCACASLSVYYIGGRTVLACIVTASISVACTVWLECVCVCVCVCVAASVCVCVCVRQNGHLAILERCAQPPPLARGQIRNNNLLLCLILDKTGFCILT